MMAASKYAMAIPPTFNGSGDDHLTCRMCLVPFSYPQRLPLSLNCLHTFCELCITAWTQNKTKQKLTCPICSKQTKVDKGKRPQDCLPVNHAILELAAVTTNPSHPAQNFGQQNGLAMHFVTEPGAAYPAIVPKVIGYADPGNGMPQAVKRVAPPPPMNGYLQNENAFVPSNQQMGVNMPGFAFDSGAIQGSYPNLTAFNPNPWSADQGPQINSSAGMDPMPLQQRVQINMPLQQLNVNPNVQNIGQPTPFGVNFQPSAGQGYQQPADTRLSNVNISCGCRSSPVPNNGFNKPAAASNTACAKCSSHESQEGRAEDGTDSGNAGGGGQVTALVVNQSAGARSTPEPQRQIRAATKLNTDMCEKCGTNPAKVTVNDSQAKLTQRLCTSCHEASKEEKRLEGEIYDRKSKAPQNSRLKTSEATNNQGRTVIKVEDKNAAKNVARGSPNCEVSVPKHSIDKSANSSKMTNVLKLGDPIRSNTPNSSTNQVAVSCGPFKAEPITNGGVSKPETSNTCNCPPTGSTHQLDMYPQAAQSRSMPHASATSAPNHDPVATTIDLGTVERIRIAPKQPKTKQSSHRERTTEDNTPALRVASSQEPVTFRPREYVVAPAAQNSGRSASRNVDSGHHHAASRPSNRSSTNYAIQTSPAAEPTSIYEVGRQEAYNPNYDANADDSRSISSLGLSTVTPRDLMSHAATTKEQEAMSYSNNNLSNGERGSREKQSYPSAGGMYPTLSAPPKYEEIESHTKVDPSLNGRMTQRGGVQCVATFGKYGEISTQPGVFKLPTRLSVSPDNKVVIVDPGNNTVQVFAGSTGECLALIRVDGVNGCCILGDGSLAVATSRGVEVYNLNGALVKKVAMGPVLSTIRYGSGFVAVQPQALVAFRDMAGGMSKTLAQMLKPGQMIQSVPFQDITDVAVNSQQDLVVLDSGSIYILNEEGFIKSIIHPAMEPCGGLKHATSVAVDQSHNILVSDTGNHRVLLFGANGRYKNTLYDGSQSPGGASSRKSSGRLVYPVGVAVNSADQTFVVTRGDKSAEVLVLKYT